MPKGSDNPFPSILTVQQGSDPATPAAGDTRVYTKAGGLYIKNDSGTVTGPFATAAGSSLLGITSFAGSTYTTSSATLADVDATNLKVTFTAPASGNVLVRLTCNGHPSSGNYMQWGLRESTTDLGTAVRASDTTTDWVLSTVAVYLTGVSAGSHTYKWSFASSSGTATLHTGIGPAVMEVWSCP
jgi:hypothetical protein